MEDVRSLSRVPDHAASGRELVIGVAGAILARDLGWTLVHEHLLIDLRRAGYATSSASDVASAATRVTREALAKVHGKPFDVLDNLVLDDVDLVAEELRAFHIAGGRTIVELTSRDIGRSPIGLRDIARLTGVQVIMGSAHYRAPAHPKHLSKLSVHDITATILGDLFEGQDGVRAGVIGEIGTMDPIHPDEVRVLQAAAVAQRDTGRAMFVHVNPWTKVGHQLLDICEQAGANLSRVVLCHLDGTLPDVGYHRSLADRGAWVSYDLFGDDRDDYDGRRFPPDSVRVEAVLQAFSAGWASRLLLAHDISLKTRLWKYGGCGYDYISTRIVPRLRASGLSARDIDSLFIDNPRSLLTHAA
jgi:phosphotriesterase-related protein